MENKDIQTNLTQPFFFLSFWNFCPFVFVVLCWKDSAPSFSRGLLSPSFSVHCYFLPPPIFFWSPERQYLSILLWTKAIGDNLLCFVSCCWFCYSYFELLPLVLFSFLFSYCFFLFFYYCYLFVFFLSCKFVVVVILLFCLLLLLSCCRCRRCCCCFLLFLVVSSCF